LVTLDDSSTRDFQWRSQENLLGEQNGVWDTVPWKRVVGDVWMVKWGPCISLSQLEGLGYRCDLIQQRPGRPKQPAAYFLNILKHILNNLETCCVFRF